MAAFITFLYPHREAEGVYKWLLKLFNMSTGSQLVQGDHYILPDTLTVERVATLQGVRVDKHSIPELISAKGLHRVSRDG